MSGMGCFIRGSKTMYYRPSYLILSFLSFLIFCTLKPSCAQAVVPAVSVSNLRHEIGHTVKIDGRTGYIVTRFEAQGMHVFTLRDDYDNQVLVNTTGGGYPVMGVTYQITGMPVLINGTLFFDTASGMYFPVYPVTTPAQSPMTPPPAKIPLFLWILSAVSALGILCVVAFFLSRWLNSPRPEWGSLTVTSGPDRGLTIPMRRSQIALGRGVNPTRDVRLSPGDQTISNRHALLLHRNGELFFCDLSSNGSWVGGEKMVTGKPTKINSGDLIHIGTQGTVIIIRTFAPAVSAPGILSRLREPAPLSDKTILLSSMTEEAPARHEQNASYSPASEHSSLPSPQEFIPPAEIVHPAAEDEDNSEDDNDEEDDIPFTFAPPAIFRFSDLERQDTEERSSGER
jgi:hypothetical protein